MRVTHAGVTKTISRREGERVSLINPETGETTKSQRLCAGKIYKPPTQEYATLILDKIPEGIKETKLEELTCQGIVSEENGIKISPSRLFATVVTTIEPPIILSLKSFKNLDDAMESIGEMIIAPILEKKEKQEKEKEKLIKDLDFIEDKESAVAAKINDQLRFIQNKIRESSGVIKQVTTKQEPVTEGVIISRIETLGTELTIEITIDRLPVRGTFPSSEGKETVFTTIAPTAECSLRIKTNIKNNTINIKRIDENNKNAGPHLTDYMCMGDYEGTFIQLIKDKKIGNLVNMMADFMTTYYSGSPLWSMSGPFSYQRQWPANVLNEIYLHGNKRVSTRYPQQTLTYNQLRDTLDQNIKDRMQESIDEINALSIPRWAQQKTGFTKYFQVREIPKKFASQDQAFFTTSQPIDSFDEMNNDLFTLIK